MDQARRGSGTSMDRAQQTDSKLHPLNAAELKSIQTAAGWQPIQDAEFVQTAVGEAHSPVTPTKWYGALRYRLPSETRDGGKVVVTPLSQIISFSEEVVSQTNR